MLRRTGMSRALLAVLLAVALLGSVGCESLPFAKASSGAPETTSVVVLLDLSGSTLKEKVRTQYRQDLERVVARMYYGDTISIWSVDKNSIEKSIPLNDDKPYPLYVEKAKTDFNKQKERKEFLAQHPIEDLRAETLKPVAARVETEKTKGSDLLGAMRVASRKLQLSGSNERWLIVFSDMLNRDDNVDMYKSFDPDKAVAKMKEAGAIPSLEGVNVIVVGAGGENTKRWDKVQKFWLGYFEAAGAKIPPAYYGTQLPEELVAQINSGVDIEAGEPSRIPEQ